MNPHLAQLQPYPFERLAKLLAGLEPPAGMKPISMGVGEPQHAVPAFILETLREALGGIAHYPNSLGSEQLRDSIAGWLGRRFALGDAAVNPQTQVLPVAGTREALFAFAQAIVDRSQTARVVMPNPFYQIYEGAALLAGAQPTLMPCQADHQWLPDFNAIDEQQWQQCQLLYLCSPANPTGAVMPMAQLQLAIELAHRHDFVIAADECYSEIYLDEATPPPGLLQAAKQVGNDRFERCVVFHSLSKRSNVPGMRSGFVAGDQNLLKAFRQYRTYHGCTMSPAVQAASAAAWSDESHVQENRALYREKFRVFLDTLDLDSLNGRLTAAEPEASFYLWPKVQIPDQDDESLIRRMYSEAALSALPGRYLARDIDGHNPGADHLRLSLVPPLEDCREAAQRLRQLIVS